MAERNATLEALALRRLTVPSVRQAPVALILTVWTSMTPFGIYILACYAGAVMDRDLPTWNAVLPGLYEHSTPGATVAIGRH